MGGDSTDSAGMLDDTWRWGPRSPTPLWGSTAAGFLLVQWPEAVVLLL